MPETRKKDRRDRYDRIYLGNLDSMHVLMPYIMPKRCDNEAVLDEMVDLTAIDAFLEKKNAEKPDFKYTLFHVITAALAKTIQLRPKMNWFISGYRMFERREIAIAFNVKRQFSDDGGEAMALFTLDREGGSVLEQVHTYVRDFVTDVRVHNKVEGTTDKMNVLMKLPRFVLKAAFWGMRVMEYYGIYPKSLKKDDPRYSSVYVSNLGSIKMNADYHHIYEGGTISFFCVIGEKTIRPFFNPDGSYVMKDSVKLGLTIDERIADGYYFAKSIRLLRHLLQNPELLELDAATPVEFE